MKNIFTVFGFSMFMAFWSLGSAQAQCPGCTIDPSCGANLNPVAPALCPAILPSGTQGQPYSENATFFMPRDFTDTDSGQDVTLNGITVTSITGIPQGLAYECNIPGCSYTVTSDPVTQRGCVKICGVPTVPGNYTIVVSVVANVTTPIGTINQPTGFTLPITIDPAPGGNCCFSYNPPTGCGDLDVEFEALLNFEPLQPTTYDWDFDNGNVSTDAVPPLQSYTAPTAAYPELTTTVHNYVITDITFEAAGSNWCGDIEESSLGGVCQGNPDIYYTFSNGNQGSQSSVGSNNIQASWTNQGLVLENNLFSLQFWDDDNGSPFGSPDDNLGVYSLNVSAPGTFQMNTFVNGNQEGFGSVTIALEVDTIYITSDTVQAFPNPPVPVPTFSPGQAVCVGDSILISAPTGPYQYQWLESGGFVSDSIAVWANATGYYTLQIVDTTYFCQAETDSFLVSVLTTISQPQLTYNSVTEQLEIDNNTGYDVAWYDDGVLIQGQTGDTLAGLVGSGPFSVTFTNEAGCFETSLDFWLCIPGQADPIANDTVCCGETLTLTASGFSLNPFTTIAWAVTPEATGPVTSQSEATTANDNGQLLSIANLGESVDYTRVCNGMSDSLLVGNYYVTPFSIENPEVVPFTYDTLEGCKPYIIICPELSAADDNWEIFPMVFTFPDGSTLNVNDAIALGLPITQQLLDLVGGLPCLNLSDLYTGDPNGQWSISVTNSGTTAIDMSVPDFVAINYADTCNLISQDEEYFIEGVDLTAAPGQTVSTTFNIPPVPGGYPNVDENCEAFGDPILVTFADCFPSLTNDLTVVGTPVNPVMNGQNYVYGYIDITITGGTLPYDVLWDDGTTTDDRFNLLPGTYTIVVTDATGFSVTETFVLTGPPLGVEELEQFGFSLEQNVPNPTNGNTTIGFYSAERMDFNFVVLDISGREVARIQITANQGGNQVIFDTSKLNAGMYTYSISNGVNILAKRMLISK